MEEYHVVLSSSQSVENENGVFRNSSRPLVNPETL